jgi:hypothetical protein
VSLGALDLKEKLGGAAGAEPVQLGQAYWTPAYDVSPMLLRLGTGPGVGLSAESTQVALPPGPAKKV